MIGNPTPQRLRVLVERLEAARRDLGFAAMLAAEVGSKKPAAA